MSKWIKFHPNQPMYGIYWAIVETTLFDEDGKPEKDKDIDIMLLKIYSDPPVREFTDIENDRLLGHDSVVKMFTHVLKPPFPDNY